MRKPIKLTKNSGAFSASFDDGFTINKNIKLLSLDETVDTDFTNTKYIKPKQPDWAQTDDKALDFIKNKHIAEQYRPITINGQEFLNEDRNSGALDIVGKGGVIVEANGNSLQLSVEDYVEGDAIDITDNDQGQKVISVDPTEITITELSQDSILILDGGGANG